MLAVRDVDLFESLDMLTIYRPAEVLSELLQHHADPKLCDFSGKSALYYVSQIESLRKQQLLDILMNSMPKPERHAESLLDICQETNSSPTDVNVPPNQNIILQSISSSEDSNQEDDCSLSILVGDRDPSGEDWLRRTEGVEIIVTFPGEPPQEISQEDLQESNQVTFVHQEERQAYSVSLLNEMETVNLGTKTLSVQTSLLKSEKSSKELCDGNLDRSLPRRCLESSVSRSVTKEEVPCVLKGQQRKYEEFPTSDMRYSSRRIEFPLPPPSLLPMRSGILTMAKSPKFPREREREIPSPTSSAPKLLELASRSDEFSSLKNHQEAAWRGLVDKTLRFSDSSIWSRNMCSFQRKVNHPRQYLGVEESWRAQKIAGWDKIDISCIKKEPSCENVKEVNISRERERSIECHSMEIRKADENSQYLSSRKKEGSTARMSEPASDIVYTIPSKLQEAPHSEITPGEKKEIGNENDSKSNSLHKAEAMEPHAMLEDFTVLKNLCNAISDDLIEELPEGDRNTETNIKIPIAEATKPEMNGMVPLIHITFPGEGIPEDPATVKQNLPKRKRTIHNNSFHILAHQEQDKHQMNIHRTKLESKTKGSNRAPQNLTISIQASIKPNMHKTSIKTQVFPALELVDPRPCQSSKFQRRMPLMEKKQSMYQTQKPKKQAFPCICKNPGIKKSCVPLPVKTTEPRLHYLDLKYSDMFKEINSIANGPGIYEMFGTPIYSHMREAERHEHRYYREICTAPSGHCVTSKCQSSQRDKNSNSRARLPQKRLHSKPLKPVVGIKQKHKGLIPKEKGCKAISSHTKGREGGDGVSEPDWQMKSSGNDFPSPTDEVQPMNFTQTPEQFPEQKESLPVSDLSIIEEIFLEESTDEGEKFNSDILAASFRDLKELEGLHHQTLSVPSEDSWAVLSERSFGKHVSPEKQDIASLDKTNGSQVLMDYLEFDSLSDKSKTLGSFSSFSLQENPESTSSPTDQHWTHSLDQDSLENKSITYQTFGKTLNDEDSISQEILNSVKNEELTDELLGCLVAELLELDEKDNSSCQTMANETEMENLDLVLRRRGNAMEELDGETTKVKLQRCSNVFQIYDEEEKFLNSNEKKTLSEKSLNQEEAILWTKGEILGRGAYGTVYCGLTSQGQLIAVKQVALDTSDKLATEKEYRKLQEEVDLLKALKHINIVAYLGTCLEENTVSIFMEFVPGGSISSIINRFGPLPEMVFCKYTRQILQGVAYLHENCVVHRDIKGNNVMLMPTGIIKLIDFGCAKRLAWAGLNGTHSDMLKSVRGSPYWMAPEVINESGYGRKSDIWSIGCTVFEMATGKPPLASMDRLAAMFYIGAHRGLMPPLPDRFSESAADFVRMCLTRDQHERPSALQLLKHRFLKRSH
ncbi:mitogen-activated protein kinase kinase kinase 19 [Nannospalax galili]|uniref:mitogen-activated protein kinase kinase kinase 19 n=1 Tax=Nannospalax galili TaxID=1026970 RepID=UPI0004ED21FB|nr:mitogen-activated protein kinase kinase kinase 19 [Nannospalax galili]